MKLKIYLKILFIVAFLLLMTVGAYYLGDITWDWFINNIPRSTRLGDSPPDGMRWVLGFLEMMLIGLLIILGDLLYEMLLD